MTAVRMHAFDAAPVMEELVAIVPGRAIVRLEAAFEHCNGAALEFKPRHFCRVLDSSSW